MKKWLAIAIFCVSLLMPFTAFASIAFDAIQQPARSTSNPATWSHTSTGSNLCGVVQIEDPSGDGIASNAVTWGGSSVTFVNKTNRGDGREDYQYIISGQPSGAQTISIANPSGHNIGFQSASYTGCKQTGQPDSSVSQSYVAVTTAAMNFTTVADNAWLVEFSDPIAGTWTASTNTFMRGTGGFANYFDSNSAQTPAGSHSLNWTVSPADTVTQLGLSIAPFVTTPATSIPSVFAWISWWW